MDGAGLFELDGTPIEPAAPRSIPAIARVFAGLAAGDLAIRVWPFLEHAFAMDVSLWAAVTISSVRGVAAVLLPAAIFTANRSAWRSHRPLVAAALLLALRELVVTATSSLSLLGVQSGYDEDAAFLWGAFTQLIGLALAAVVPWLLLRGLAPWTTVRHAARTGRLPLVAWTTIVIALEVLQLITAPGLPGRVVIMWLVLSAITTLALLGWAWLGLVGLALIRDSKTLWSFALTAVACWMGSALALIVLGLVAEVTGGGRLSSAIAFLPSLLDTAAILALLPTLWIAVGKQKAPTSHDHETASSAQPYMKPRA